MKVRLFFLSLLFAAAGCAAVNPWVNSRVPQSQWDKDWTRCKERAQFQMGTFMAWEKPFPSALDAFDHDREKTQDDDLVDTCMIGLGYVPKPPEPKPVGSKP